MRYLSTLLLIAVTGFLEAQILPPSPQGAYASIGTYSSNFTNAFSFIHNQASLAKVKNLTAGIYSVRPYNLESLQAISSAISFPLSSGAAGIAVDYINFPGLNHTSFGLAYGLPLAEKVQLGVQFNYHHLSLAGYGGANAITMEIGTIIHLTDHLHAGCHLFNPLGAKFSGNNEEKMASVYNFGLGYEVSEKLFIGAEITKVSEQPVDCNVTFHYYLVKQVFLRAGVSLAVNNYYAGAGILWHNMRLEVAVDLHPTAGLTPGLLVVFFLPKIKHAQE